MRDPKELDRQIKQERIDQIWQEKLEREAERKREAERSCHRGPGDPDWKPER
jgi:hypothetical protein